MRQRLQLGAELGVFGLLVFLAMLREAFRIARAGRTSPLLPAADRLRHTALLLSLTGYCAGGFFLSQAYGNILYILLALAAIMHLERRRLENAVSIPFRKKTAEPSGLLSPAPALSTGLMQRADAARNAREELLRRGKAELSRSVSGKEAGQ